MGHGHLACLISVESTPSTDFLDFVRAYNNPVSPRRANERYDLGIILLRVSEKLYRRLGIALQQLLPIPQQR